MKNEFNPARIPGFKAQMLENAARVKKTKKDTKRKEVKHNNELEEKELDKTADLNSIRIGIKSITKHKIGNGYRSEKS
jgi:predicted phage tail protein